MIRMTARLVTMRLTTPVPVSGYSTPLHDARLARLGGVLHGDDHPLGPHRKVHRATDAAHPLRWHHPVGEVALLRHLKAAENGEVDVATPDYDEGVGAVKEARSRQKGDRLAAGVNAVPVDTCVLTRRGARSRGCRSPPGI